MSKTAYANKIRAGRAPGKESDREARLFGENPFDIVGDVFGGIASSESAQHDASKTAEKIARAYNSHDELLAACEAVADNNGGPIDGMVGGQWIEGSYVMVRREDFDALCAVIKQAKGE